VQPIIITIQLGDPAALQSAGGIWVAGTGGSTTIPGPLALAQLQVKQEMMADSADLLARRVDMNTHAYSYALRYFPQQQVSINLANSAAVQSVNLTGFRAGEVQRILMWLNKGSDTTASGNLYWQQMQDVTLTYNGEIFFRADGTCSNLWNLIANEKTGVVTTSTVSSGVPTAANSYWVDIPFSQVNMPYDKEIKLLHGKPILNAVVNLQLKTPSAAADWTLNVLYLYNASLLCSRGGAEYVF
jgi:hypothetical protein